MMEYGKYLVYAVAIFCYFKTMMVFVKDEKLRTWLMGSFEEANTNKASGKALSAFVLIHCVAVGWFIAIHYSEKHIPLEYMFWGILGLITSLYGIKEIGRTLTNKSNGNGKLDVQPKEAVQLSEEDKALMQEWKDADTELTFEEYKKSKTPATDV